MSESLFACSKCGGTSDRPHCPECESVLEPGDYTMTLPGSSLRHPVKVYRDFGHTWIIIGDSEPKTSLSVEYFLDEGFIFEKIGTTPAQ